MDLETQAESPLSWNIRRLTVREYERMAEVGILQPDEKVELLEGVLVAVSPQNEPHALAIERLTVALIRELSGSYRVRSQLPIEISEDSEPEPDFAVLPLSDAPPGERPKHAELIIEVAHTSLGKDRRLKGRIYARAGVPEYWIVNVNERCIEVHRDPDTVGGRYRLVTTVREGGKVVPASLPGPTIEVAALFA